MSTVTHSRTINDRISNVLSHLFERPIIIFGIGISIWHYYKLFYQLGESQLASGATGLFIDVVHYCVIAQHLRRQTRWSRVALLMTTLFSYVIHVFYWLTREATMDVPHVNDVVLALFLGSLMPVGISVVAWLDTRDAPDVDALLADVKRMTSELQTVTRERDTLESAVTAVTNERDVLATSVSAVTRERDQLTKRVTKLESAEVAMTERVNTLSGESSSNTRRIDSLTLERDKLAREVTRLTEQNSLMEQRESVLSGEVDTLRSRAKLAEARLDDLTWVDKASPALLGVTRDLALHGELNGTVAKYELSKRSQDEIMRLHKKFPN